MPRIVVKRRLRPVRFAFLVRPNSMRELLSVFQINTVLWGGRYNIIMPAWQRCPTEHEGEGTGRNVVRRFLDAAEPDFVVVGDVAPKSVGLPDERVLRLDEMLKDPSLPTAGVGVIPLYRSLYEREFRFVSRHPRKLVLVKPDRRLAAFSAARFGTIPGGRWNHCVTAFRDLGASEVALTEATYCDELLQCWHPLALGSDGIEVRVLRRTAFLFLDPSNFLDLVDYWNLRACGWHVLPVPLPWIASMAPAVSKILEAAHRPSRAIRRDVTAGHIIKGRSIAAHDFAAFREKLSAASGTILAQSWMPRYWRRDRWESDHVGRPELSAASDEIEVQSENRRVSFRTLPPSFSTVRDSGSGAQWANVISFRCYESPELAEVIPPGVDRVAHAIAMGYDAQSYRCSSEGITVLDHADGGPHFWNLPDGATVFAQVLKGRYDLKVSTAGHLTSRMIAVLGGPELSRVACSPPMIKLFDEAARSASRSMNFNKFWNGVLREFRNDKEVASRVMDRWTESGVVDLGLQLACGECGQTNWFPLSGLAKNLSCQRCLEEFSFPCADPKRASWAVRPVGPFAVEGYGQGGFAVALTIRLLRLHGGRARTTWVPGLQLKNGAGNEIEVDFAMLRQRDGPGIEPVHTLFGECKTFGRFEKADAGRMRLLASEFPGAFLVFACLNDSLTSQEVKLIRPIAQRGRKGWRNPVIVLTARELANDWNPPMCWKTGEEATVAHQCPPLMTLTALADATQQLRLGLPPGEGWPHPQWWQREIDAQRSAVGRPADTAGD